MEKQFTVICRNDSGLSLAGQIKRGVCSSLNTILKIGLGSFRLHLAVVYLYQASKLWVCALYLSTAIKELQGKGVHDGEMKRSSGMTLCLDRQETVSKEIK